MTAYSVPATRYTDTAIALHWLLALMLLVSFGVGRYMADLPLSPQRLRLFNWHKWAGATILALTLLRLLWRATHRPPALPTMPRWQVWAARLSHALLYLLCLAVPLVGWGRSAAAGYPLVWFGVLPLPDIAPVDRDLTALLKTWHANLAWALAALVLLHLGAALKHQLIDRDGLLARMRPGWFRPARSTPTPSP